MNKIALCIPRPGMSHTMIGCGYADTLEYLGWKVYRGDPKTKLCCKKWIEEYGIILILTHSRYGIRQLPIKCINDNNVMVVVDALPLNSANVTVNGTYEYAHEDEFDLISKIAIKVVHTRLETNLWSKYMCGWGDIGLICLPAAGNMIRALPPTCSVLTDVAMVVNFDHRQEIMKNLIEPLFKRIDMLGYSYQVFGDKIWQLAGLTYNGPLECDASKLAHIYATAKVCPNVHTSKQVILQTSVNERSFMIPLCGGVQVSDNILVSKYLESHCEVATSTTDFMNRVIGLIENQPNRFEKIKASVEHVAHNHTYFNRLAELFNTMGASELVSEVETKGKRAAVRHCLELNARLSAEERNVPYEQQAIKTA